MKKEAAFRGDKAFLSNFYPCTVVVGGIKYPTAEHAFQACKSLDDQVRRSIAMAGTPGLAKRAGKSLKLRPDWESVKLDCMELVLRAKFQDNRELMDQLVATGQEHLEETNWWGDRFWGVCQGSGQNHLGKLLMRIRKENQ